MVPNYSDCSDCQKASQSFSPRTAKNTSRVVSAELARRRTEHNLFCQRSSSSFFDKSVCTPFCASLSAFSGQFDTHVFSDVHAAGENVSDLFFAVRGEKLCEAFGGTCKAAKS